MDRILNIGFPFVGRRGGDSSRARVVAGALASCFQVDDLLLVKSDEEASSTRSSHSDDHTEILHYRPGRGLRPASVCQFEAEELERFQKLLQGNNYKAFYFRYIGPTRLSLVIQHAFPAARVIIDADMLVSRLARQAWQQNRCLRNRYFFFESIKLLRYERWLFNQPFLFLMSNSKELAYVAKHLVRPGAQSQFALVPNAMPDISDSDAVKGLQTESDYILFHGMLNSSVNRDAFEFLASEIYPRVQSALEKYDVRIRVVGRGLSDFHQRLVNQNGCARIDLVGEVDDIGRSLTESLLCLIPLRMGSGTKTRVLEAAAYEKCVVTTSLGAEGLHFADTEIVVQDSPEGIASSISQLLDDRPRILELATNLRKRSIELYSEENVSRQLLGAMASYRQSGYSPH